MSFTAVVVCLTVLRMTVTAATVEGGDSIFQRSMSDDLKSSIDHTEEAFVEDAPPDGTTQAGGDGRGAPPGGMGPGQGQRPGMAHPGMGHGPGMGHPAMGHRPGMGHPGMGQGPFGGGQHNPQYDQEAFLGKDGAAKVRAEHLTPQQAQERLNTLAHRIDKDKDGAVDQGELLDWMMMIHKKERRNKADYWWLHHTGLLVHSPHGPRHVTQEPGKEKEDPKTLLLSWDKYKGVTFPDKHPENVKVNEEVREKLLKREERRFISADVDGDGMLSYEEYFSFINPSDAEHMQDVGLLEVLGEVDKNEDAGIDVDEFLNDLAKNYQFRSEEDKTHFREKESKTFTRLDQDGDGLLKGEEILGWLWPEKDDLRREAEHLIGLADDDKDQKLTYEEVMKHHRVFLPHFRKEPLVHDEM